MAASLNEYSKKSSEVVLKNVTKRFIQPDTGEEFVAVNSINLTVNDGEMVTLLGPSGCGKTTTLRMISGFEYPSEGNIYIGGRDVAMVPANKRGISMVFQSYALFPHLNIWENIAYGLRVQKKPKEQIKEDTDKVIRLMQLDGMEKRFPNQLSGGQQQRVALARAVVIEPSVLLFDEPLSNLDAKLRETMRDELRDLQKRLGITSLYVTHDQAEAMAIADRIVIMRDGNIEQAGTPQEIYAYPVNRFVANFIGKANFLSDVCKGKAADGLQLAVGDRLLTVPDPGSMAPEEGKECFLSFRPEAASVAEDGPGLAGVVSRATYFGSKMQYGIEVGGDTLVIEETNPKKVFAAGDRVRVTLDTASARVLKD